MYYWTKDIIIDPTDPTQDTWYAGVFSGWGGPPNGLGGLYKTAARGPSWTKLTGSQFDRVTSLTFNPQNTDQAYLTTETQGLWISNDMDNAVPAWELVSSYPFRQPERVFFNPYNQNEVWITSFGNGMKRGLLVPSETVEKPEKSDLIRVFPNPSDEIVFFSNLSENPISTINIYNEQGQLIISKKNQGDFLDTAGLPPGVYLLEFVFSNNSSATKKLVK